MKAPTPDRDAAFDTYADDYEAALNQGIGLSGEGKDYFARGRILFLQRRLRALGVIPRSILDYGCGTGSATPYFKEILKLDKLAGVDLSSKSIEVAEKTYGPLGAIFHTLEAYVPDASFDLAFCNGVFHHISLGQRLDAARYVYNSLRPGGLFAFWENNPWNPGTRMVMSRIPFDHDAIKFSPPAAKRLLHEAGFEVLRTDFLFIFPRFLGVFRAIEPALSRLPMGAQYQVLCRRV
ncbi:MAG TPA: methyltransferase domain-containing protein [Tepidisphaeraceae bacterium]|nr:methyltransferase domain-containing protein [Tepidisphaeraceae bacterium]